MRSKPFTKHAGLSKFYRLRWIIEEYFHTLKTAGFDIELADIGAPQVMIKFVTAVAVAAVTVMQLVKARDGTTTGQKLAVVFYLADQPILASRGRDKPHGDCSSVMRAHRRTPSAG